MSRSIIWSRTARTDLRTQLEYIGQQSPKNAAIVGRRIAERVTKLAHMPAGHRGRVEGTFEVVVQLTSLILVYRVLEKDRLQIVRLIHASRDWQAGEWPSE